MRSLCEYDLELFGQTFFPHYCRQPWSELHRHLIRQYLKQQHRPVLERKGRNYAVAAPRGYAKSTLATLLLVLHDIVYEAEGYIIIVSATLPQSIAKLKSIRAELTGNQTLLSHYVPRVQRVTRRQLVANETAVEAFSVGTELRGITHLQYRPTKIVIDDGEDSDAVESAEQREHLAEWFKEVLENLGNGYTNIVVVGTLLHPDSLLSKILKRPDFDSRIFRAVESFADNTTLWENWRRKLNNLADLHRMDAARAYFENHCEEMLKGARVLWPSKEDYYSLMLQLTTRGRKSFFQEKQNEPRYHEAQLFDPEQFQYFHLQGVAGDESDRAVSLDDLACYGFLDSALGGAGGDFAAVATVGRDEHGYLYLLDVWMERATSTRQIQKIFDLHELWNYRTFGFEANCFQSLLAQPIEDERKRRRDAGRPWDLPIEEVTHRENKVRRIASLETLIANGWLIFSRDLNESFLRQAEEFPRGAHDDGLDALESAVALARRNPIGRSHRTGRRRSTRHLKSY